MRTAVILVFVLFTHVLIIDAAPLLGCLGKMFKKSKKRNGKTTTTPPPIGTPYPIDTPEEKLPWGLRRHGFP